MKLNALTKAITLATLLSAASFSAVAEDIPLSAVVEADQISTKVVSVDAAKHEATFKFRRFDPRIILQCPPFTPP